MNTIQKVIALTVLVVIAKGTLKVFHLITIQNDLPSPLQSVQDRTTWKELSKLKDRSVQIKSVQDRTTWKEPPKLKDRSVQYRSKIKVEQNFPVHMNIFTRENRTISIQIDEHIIQRHLMKRGIVPGKWKYNNNPLLRQFMPLMSKQDMFTQLVTLETFAQTCERNNLTYFLCSGTLLGSYRHHGIVPWDDDVDVVFNASDWWRIRNVLSRVEGYELFAPSRVQWKFYKKDLPPNLTPSKIFKWPFIDIFFFSENSTHIWGLTDAIKGELNLRKEDVFPLQQRQFEHIKLFVPCKTRKIILRNYGIIDCITVMCEHRRDRCGPVRKVRCEQLHPMFPFVFRQRDPRSDSVIETLKLGQRILNQLSVPNGPCKVYQ